MVDGSNDDSTAPCSVCNILITSEDFGLCCDGYCSQWFHPGCVNVEIDSYHQITRLSEHVKWYCETCGEKVNKIITSALDVDDLLSIRLNIEKVLKVVTKVVDDNAVLKKRVDEIYETTREVRLCHQDKQETGGVKPAKPDGRAVLSSAVDERSKTTVPHSGTDGSKLSLSSDRRVNQEDDDHLKTVLPASQQSCLSDADDDTNQPLAEESELSEAGLIINNRRWETVKSKGPRPRPSLKRKNAGPIIGTRALALDDTTKLRAVVKKKWIFVSRLAVDVTVEDIKQYLGKAEITAECFELKTKYNTYKSFKVGVNAEHTDKLLDSDFWPVNTLVREFVIKANNLVMSRTFLGKTPK